MTSDHQTPDNVFYQSINQFQHPIRGLACNLSEVRNHGDTPEKNGKETPIWGVAQSVDHSQKNE